MEHTFRFVFQSKEDATVCYSILHRLIGKLEDFYKSCKDLSSVELCLKENEDNGDKLAYFLISAGENNISEYSKSAIWEDALLDVFDKVTTKFKEPITTV